MVMSIITFDRVPARHVRVLAAPTVDKRGFWARTFDRFVEGRQRKARQELRRYHRQLLPRELDDAGWKTGRSEDSLPFVR
jgi:hypothetical protein